MISSNIASFKKGAITTSMLYETTSRGIVTESEFFGTFIERTRCDTGATIIVAHNCVTERDVKPCALIIRLIRISF